MKEKLTRIQTTIKTHVEKLLNSYETNLEKIQTCFKILEIEKFEFTIICPNEHDTSQITYGICEFNLNSQNTITIKHVKRIRQTSAFSEPQIFSKDINNTLYPVAADEFILKTLLEQLINTIVNKKLDTVLSHIENTLAIGE